jgi:hypothetical protein
MAEIKPSKATVGLPDTPFPLVMLRPVPETAIERFVTVDAPVFTITPLEAASRLPEAPLRVT